MNIFLALTVVFIPVMVIYYTGGHYKDSENYMWSAITLGNYGFVESHCYFWYADIPNGQFFPKCASGKINSLKYYGLTSTFHNKKENLGENFCGDHSNLTQIKFCTQNQFKGNLLEKDFKEKCVGQKECKLNLKPYVKLLENQKRSLFAADIGPNKGEISVSNIASLQCFMDDAHIYIQYDCSLEEEVAYRLHIGCVLACICVFSCFLFLRDFFLYDLFLYDAYAFHLFLRLDKDLFVVMPIHYQTHYIQ